MHAHRYHDKRITAMCPCAVKICLTHCRYIHCSSASGGVSCLLMQNWLPQKAKKNTHKCHECTLQNWTSETKLMPPMACHFHKDTGDAWQPQKNFVFLPQAHFGSWATCLSLKFRHCVGIASIHIDISDRRQCQQSKTVFSSDRCLCTGSLFSVSLLHCLASGLLQCIALGSWLWRRFRLRFVHGLGNHRGDLHVAALDLLLHVREIGCRDVKLRVQLHVQQMMSHLAPQCCHGLVVLDLATASPQSNKLGNDRKQKHQGKRNMTAWAGAFVQPSYHKSYPHDWAMPGFPIDKWKPNDITAKHSQLGNKLPLKVYMKV